MKKNILKVIACILAVTLTLGSTSSVAFAAEPGTEETTQTTNTESTTTTSSGKPSGFITTVNLGKPSGFITTVNLGNPFAKPKEPEYVTVSTYYCNCPACYHTTDYNALKQHMFQHVLKGQRYSYHTVVEKVLKQ